MYTYTFHCSTKSIVNNNYYIPSSSDSSELREELKSVILFIWILFGALFGPEIRILEIQRQTFNNNIIVTLHFAASFFFWASSIFFFAFSSRNLFLSPVSVSPVLELIASFLNLSKLVQLIFHALLGFGLAGEEVPETCWWLMNKEEELTQQEL